MDIIFLLYFFSLLRQKEPIDIERESEVCAYTERGKECDSTLTRRRVEKKRWKLMSRWIERPSS